MKKFLITFWIFLTMNSFCFASQKEDINIVFAIDKNYPVYTMITMDSIIKHSSNSNFSFYILENNLTSFQKFMMKNYAKKKNVKISFIHTNPDEITKGYNFYENLNHITSISIVRILIPELLPKDIDKALYLDADILVLDDIKKLYNTNLEGNWVSMTEETCFISRNYKNKYKNFCNAGVILMDLKSLREFNFTNKTIEYIDNHFENFLGNFNLKINDKDKLILADQDLLNIILDGHIKVLPLEWNYTKKILKKNIKPSIIHFAASEKPWFYIINKNKVINTDERFFIYNDYWKKSGLEYLKIYLKYTNFVNYRISLYKKMFGKFVSKM